MSDKKPSSKGIKWGPFTARFPLVHFRIEWPELSQGFVVALSTGLALVPLLTLYFGLTFEEAVTISLIHSILIASASTIFGEPFAPGWVTPALPLTLAFVLGQYEEPTARFQAMTALTVDFTLLLFFMGITGLGSKLINRIPVALKAGIILGAALAAFQRVFIDDFDKIEAMPVSITLALVVSLIVAFSIPFHVLKGRFKSLALIASLGLLPGFAVAGIAGTITGELVFDIQWGILNPPFADMMAKASPFSIGWPSLTMFLEALPLALITYMILFGDLLTGVAILKDGQKSRPDDVIDVDINRSHLSIALRNAVMAVTAPFFPTQGALWTGVHVIIVNRWKEGKEKMQTLHGGIGAYYLYAVPIFILALPLITFLKPFLYIALMITLILTGFACAYVAMEMAKGREQKGVMLITAFFLVTFEPWVGLVVGLLSVILILGPAAFKKQVAV